MRNTCSKPIANRGDAIECLCALVDEKHLVKALARNEAEAARWTASTLAKLHEYYRIKPVENDGLNVIESALLEWREIEKIVLSAAKASPLEFDHWFSSVRNTLQKDQSIIVQPGTRLYNVLSAAAIVRNIEWVRTFSWALPQLFPDRQKELAQIGGRVAAIFYLEQIDKWVRHPSSVQSAPAVQFEKIDAYWVFATELAA